MVDTSLDTSLNSFLEDAEAVLAEEHKPVKDPILMFQDLQDQSLRLVQLIEANHRLMGELGCALGRASPLIPLRHLLSPFFRPQRPAQQGQSRGEARGERSSAHCAARSEPEPGQHG